MLDVLGNDLPRWSKEREEAGHKALHTQDLQRVVRNAPALFELHLGLYKSCFDSINPNDYQGTVLPTNMLTQCFGDNYWMAYGFFGASTELANQIVEKFRNTDMMIDIISMCEKKAKISMDNLLTRPNGRLNFYQTHFTKIANTIDPNQDKRLFDMYTQLVENFKAAQSVGERSAVLKKARDRVARIQKQLFFLKNSPDNLNLITPTRYHICDAQFKKKFSKGGHLKSSQSYWFFLFNDLLLYTTLPDKKNKIEPKYALPLLGAYVEEGEKGNTNLTLAIKSPIKDITIKCKDAEQKEEWKQHLCNVISNLTQAADAGKTSYRTKKAGKRGW